MYEESDLCWDGPKKIIGSLAIDDSFTRPETSEQLGWLTSDSRTKILITFGSLSNKMLKPLLENAIKTFYEMGWLIVVNLVNTNKENIQIKIHSKLTIDTTLEKIYEN